jgi:hypothetical protein
MTKETTKSVYASLHRIQSSLKAPKQANKNVSYKSRSAEQILDAVKDFLEDGEVIIINDDIVHIGDRFYVKAVASLCLGSECVSSTAFAREQDESKMMQPPQITGASSSYARKYSLQGLLAIDDSKDDPDQNAHPVDDAKKKPEQKPEKPPLSPEEQEKVDTYNRIFTALKEAKDLKTLNAVWHLQEKEILKLPKAGQDKLKQVHDLVTADFANVTMAG